MFKKEGRFASCFSEGWTGQRLLRTGLAQPVWGVRAAPELCGARPT